MTITSIMYSYGTSISNVCLSCQLRMVRTTRIRTYRRRRRRRCEDANDDGAACGLTITGEGTEVLQESLARGIETLFEWKNGMWDNCRALRILRRMFLL